MNENAKELVAAPTSPLTGSSTATIAAGNVFISSQYLNINGTIQIGSPEREINVAQNAGLDQAITNANAAYQTQGVNSRYVALNQYVEGEATLQYDAQKQRLELTPDLQIETGSMFMVGHILNTGGGALKVLDGYGTINVTNQSNYDLVIDGTLDAGTGSDAEDGLEGTISIIDTSRTVRVNGKDEYLYTIVTRDGDTITMVDNTTVDASGNPNNVTTTTTGSTVEYQPLENQRYYWTTSRANYNKDHYFLKVTDENTAATIRETYDVLDIINDPNTIESPIVDTSDTTTYFRGEYVKTEAIDDIYTYSYENIPTLNRITTFQLYTYRYESGGFVRDEWTIVRTVGSVDIHTHSVKADLPINISFLGGPGSISVTSPKDIYIGGTIAARGGEVNITSTGGSIESVSSATPVIGKIITLSAKTGIGTESALFTDYTDVAGGYVSAVTESGPINLTETKGDLPLLEARTTGDVLLKAVTGGVAAVALPFTDVTHIQAQSVTILANGSVGSEAVPLQVDSGPENGDNVIVVVTDRVAELGPNVDIETIDLESDLAGGDIYLTEVKRRSRLGGCINKGQCWHYGFRWELDRRELGVGYEL